MNTAISWAAREIELAKKKTDNEELKRVYDEAFDMYKRILNECDGDTSHPVLIELHRLFKRTLLTAIEDNDEDWSDCTWNNDSEYISYQNKRKSSIFKDVYTDGTIKYTDVGRAVCVTNGIEHHFGFAIRTAEELGFIPPIEMPYVPYKNPYKVRTEDFLHDQNHGDFDTVALIDVTDPFGDVTRIGKYYTEDETTGEFVEISKEQYYEWKKTALRISDDNGFYVSPSYNPDQNMMSKCADKLSNPRQDQEAVEHD